MILLKNPVRREEIPGEIKSYVAGLIDGEGSVTISERARTHRRCKNPSFILSVDVSMTNRYGVDEIIEHYRGRLNIYIGRTANRKSYYQFDATSIEALELLTSIIPYLRVKKPQAELGIAFLSIPRFQGGIGRELPPDIIIARRMMAREMKGLNK